MLLKNESICSTKDPPLIYEQACLDIVNFRNENVTIYGQYTECDKCGYQSQAFLAPNDSTSLLVNTEFPISMYYLMNHSLECPFEKALFEHYRYGWNLTKDCTPIFIKKTAADGYLPVLNALIVLFFFGLIWFINKCTTNKNWKRFSLWTTKMENETLSSQEEKPLAVVHHSSRIKSVDVFRGFCTVTMVFINYGGGQYWFFRHGVWNGLNFADLIFPWFLWIMGFCSAISLHNKFNRAVSRRQLFSHLVQRSFVLIFIGIVLNSHASQMTLDRLRLPGVLQRIGFTYLIVGILEIVFAERNESMSEYGRFSFLQDILVAWPQWILVTLLVAIHTILIFTVEVPGCGRGYLGPGGLHNHKKFINCTGGLAGYIDRKIFHNHLFKYSLRVYETEVYFDHHGILGTFTSVFLSYLGVQAGRILKTYFDVRSKIIRWIVWGVTTSFLGGLLCRFTKNDGPIPINKKLLSLSFVLVVAGLAFLIQAVLFVVVDITRVWSGQPFFYPGMNPLVIYVGSELFKDVFPFGWIPSVKTHANYLGMNLWGTGLWVVIAIVLYKRNIFVSL